jgi:hypothetical protein
MRWGFSGGLLAPGAVGSADELEGWLRTGEEPRGTDGGFDDTVTARQVQPGPLTISQAPRIGFTIACSAAFFVLFLILTRLPASAVGVAGTLVAGAIGVAAIYWPQPVARAASASQPGLLAALVVLLIQLAARSLYMHRITHLPGFSRTLPEPPSTPAPTAGPSTSRNRPQIVGSSGAQPVVQAGG